MLPCYPAVKYGIPGTHIDLSADYRLTDPQVYADWYGHEHTDGAGLRDAVYGLPELFRDQILPAPLIANPGCYTSTNVLALAPLIAEDLIERTAIIVDAKSGVSVAGRSPKLKYHFPRVHREPRSLQRRPAPADPRDRPSADDHDRRARRTGRSHLHFPPRAHGPGNLRHDPRPSQAAGRRA